MVHGFFSVLLPIIIALPTIAIAKVVALLNLFASIFVLVHGFFSVLFVSYIVIVLPTIATATAIVVTLLRS